MSFGEQRPSFLVLFTCRRCEKTLRAGLSGVVDFRVDPVPTPDTLEARQTQLQAEADALRRQWRLDEVLSRIGPVHYTGSYVSGLMVWRDLDVMVLVPSGFGLPDLVGLLADLVALPGLAGFDVHDERGPRSPTGQRRDERWHLPLLTDSASGAWRIDLTLWLYDAHVNLTHWHEELRARVTPEQRAAILTIKNAWQVRPEYPDRVSGLEIYTAVLEDGVRTPEQFSSWLATGNVGRSG
jgi:hypothetical protein